jgi:hypothetical protein
VAENRDQVALTPGFHLQNAEPVLVIVAGDALDKAGQNLRRSRRPCSGDLAMMDAETSGFQDSFGRLLDLMSLPSS